MLLVIARLVQGIALGGEVRSASAVLLEAAPHGKRALDMSLQGMSQGVATLTSGIVRLSLALVLSPALQRRLKTDPIRA